MDQTLQSAGVAIRYTDEGKGARVKYDCIQDRTRRYHTRELMQSDTEKLVKKNPDLNHLEFARVDSHVQRNEDDWVINTLMIEGYDEPFKYSRKKTYRNLEGSRVNLTYYAQLENVAGLEFEVMKVVRIRRS